MWAEDSGIVTLLNAWSVVTPNTHQSQLCLGTLCLHSLKSHSGEDQGVGWDKGQPGTDRHISIAATIKVVALLETKKKKKKETGGPSTVFTAQCWALEIYTHGPYLKLLTRRKYTQAKELNN